MHKSQESAAPTLGAFSCHYSSQSTLSSEDLDINVSKFYGVLSDVISTKVHVSGTSNSRFPPWYNSEMKTLVHDKKIAHSAGGKVQT